VSGIAVSANIDASKESNESHMGIITHLLGRHVARGDDHHARLGPQWLGGLQT